MPLERDNSEEFLKREARAAQLAEEIEASATYKARVALENDERSEEEKFTAVVRGERETHTLSRLGPDMKLAFDLAHKFRITTELSPSKQKNESTSSLYLMNILFSDGVRRKAQASGSMLSCEGGLSYFESRQQLLPEQTLLL